MGNFFFGAVLFFGFVILVLKNWKSARRNNNGSDGTSIYFHDSGSSGDTDGNRPGQSDDADAGDSEGDSGGD